MKRVIFVVWICVQFLILSSYSLHLPPKVSLRVEQENCFEGQPIVVTVTIDHMQSDEVDMSSFRIENEPLKVQQLGMRAVVGGNSEPRAEDMFVTTQYTTSLSPRSAGIYVVGPLDVRIGGASFRSNAITINVLESVITRQFTISSLIEAPRTIYPGQKITIIYTLLFPNSIQILREELPLLDLSGFIPLSSPQVVDRVVRSDLFEEKITRDFRAVYPGDFSFGSSIIEGMKYVDRGDTRDLIPPLLTAREEGKKIVVTAFPEKGKPSFFDGALGSFVWRGRILGSNQVKLDSPIEVEWRVTGRGDIDTIRFPTLSDSTVFASRFLIDGALREVRVDESTKTFSLTLRPKMVGIRQVPGFQFASFDPVTKEYISVACPPLALGVEELKAGEETIERPVEASSHFLLPYDPILGQCVDADLPLSLGTVWIFSLFFVVVGAIEKYYVSSLRQKTHVRKSQNVYYKAFAKRSQPKVSLRLLKEAFLLRLVEVGLIEDDMMATKGLSSRGVTGEVKRIIEMIDENLFGKGESSPSSIWKEASLVYHTLKSLPEVKKNEK